jgi:hypothetical protein
MKWNETVKKGNYVGYEAINLDFSCYLIILYLSIITFDKCEYTIILKAVNTPAAVFLV